MMNEMWLYAIEISIGTPPQTTYVSVDTGSSELWVNANCSTAPADFGQRDMCIRVPRYETNKSTTAQGPFGSARLTYGSLGETVTGADVDYYKDEVSINGVNVSSQQFGVATASLGLPVGIMGLAPDLKRGFALNESYPLLLDTLARDGIINSRAYSVNTARRTDDSGSLILGGVDKGKFEGTLLKLPIVRSHDGVVRLTVDLTSVGMTLPNTNITKTYSLGNDTNVVIDTGNTFSKLHPEVVSQVYSGLGATFNETLGYPLVDCNITEAKGGFLLNFGNKTITVPLSDFILAADELCAVGLLPIEQAGQQVLGDTFLRAAYAVVDWDNENIHLAQAANCGSDVIAIGSGVDAVPSVTGNCATMTPPTSLVDSLGSRTPLSFAALAVVAVGVASAFC